MTHSRQHLIPLLLFATALLAPARAHGQAQFTVVASESRLWVEGRSTVNTFECVADEVDGRAVLDSIGSAAEVDIPVASFDCGKKRMNRDFSEAMKADAHPRIEFELLDAELVSRRGAEYDLVVRGQLTIAGVTRAIGLRPQARRGDDGRFRVTGRVALSMRDFGIEPPTALAGLIRAHDRIVVGFDLVTAVNGTATAAPTAAVSYKTSTSHR